MSATTPTKRGVKLVAARRGLSTSSPVADVLEALATVEAERQNIALDAARTAGQLAITRMLLRLALVVACLVGLLAFGAGRASAATPPPPMPRGVMSWYGMGAAEAGGPIACGTGRLNPNGFAVAMRRDSGVKCGQRVVICATTGRCVWARVLDRGPFVAGREIDALPRVVKALGLDLDHGVYEVTWRPVPTTATRGCYFPRWVGRPYWPGCTR